MSGAVSGVQAGYKQTEVGLIPVDWEVKKLGEIFTVKSGEFLPKNKHVKGDFPIYGGNGINGYHNEYLFENEKIIIGRVGAYCGSVFHSEKYVWITDNALYIDVKKYEFYNDYIYYLLTYLRLNSYASTTAQPMLSGQILKQIKILFCSNLSEQKRIAEILTTVDDKIQNIEQQIVVAQTLKKGLMQRLFSKGILQQKDNTPHTTFKNSPLGKIPESWEVKTFLKCLEGGEIIHHMDGNHGGLYPKANEFVEDGGIPYVAAKDFAKGSLQLELCKSLSIEKVKLLQKGFAKNNDVLFAHNATVGPVCVLKTNLEFVVLSTTATYFRCDLSKLNNNYLSYYLQSEFFKNQYIKVMGQSTRNQVPITMQRSFFGIFPPLKEQIKIAEILSTADEKINNLQAKKSAFSELKKGLMQQLLTGKIRTV